MLRQFIQIPITKTPGKVALCTLLFNILPSLAKGFFVYIMLLPSRFANHRRLRDDDEIDGEKT